MPHQSEPVTQAEQRAAIKSDFMRLEHKIDLAVRDLKIWTGSVAIALFTALVAVCFFFGH